MEINKNVDESDLIKTEKNLLLIHHLIIEENKKILKSLNGNFHENSHFVMVVSNRSTSFIRSFLNLTEFNNYQTAICIIRLQLDNCLRLYAYSIADESPTFYERVLRGEPIKNMKDRNGKLMNDGYLTSELDKTFNGIKELYKNTSGYVHFSHNHLFINTKIKSVNNEKLIFSNKIGGVDELEIYQKIDFAFNMFCASKWLLELVSEFRIELEQQFNN